MLKLFKNRIQRVVKNEQGSIMMYVMIFMVFFLPFAIWVGVQLPIKYQYTYEIKQTTNNMADSMISRLDETELAKGNVIVNETIAYEVAENMMKTAYNLNDEFESNNEEGVLKEKLNLHFHPIGRGYDNVKNYLDENLEKEDGKYILPNYELPQECENPDYRNAQPDRCKIKPHETDGVHVFVLNVDDAIKNQGKEPLFFKNIELPIENTSVVIHSNIPVENGGLLGGRTVVTRTGISEAEIYLGENE